MVLLLNTLFGGLAYWQICRYIERSAWLEHLKTQYTLPPLPLSNISESWQSQEGRHVTAEGRFLTPYTVFLDNQLHQGAAGYRVLSAFTTDDDAPWIWVDRGWVPIEGGREKLPVIPDLLETVELTGLVAKPMYNQLVFTVSDFKEVTWPLRVQSMDINWLSEQIGVAFYPWVLDVIPTDPVAFTKTKHTPWLTPLRHQVYALQWLSFALITWGFWGRFTIRTRSPHASSL